LQATLPTKPGADQLAPFQQRISLGLGATAANIEWAEKEARKIDALKSCGQFSWEPYLKIRVTQPETCSEWIDRYTAHYRESVSQVTWLTDYHNAFRKLPGDRPLTEELLRSIVIGVEGGTRTRKRVARAFTRLAKFAGLQADFGSIQGNYNSKSLEPRDIPSDEAIIEVYERMSNLSWRWVYGAIATFGLRSHEVFFLDTSDLATGGSSVFVTEGKTGSRHVWAFRPEWVDLFGLRHKNLPNVTGKTHAIYTHRTAKYFGQIAQLPFTALDLRHAWAIRTLEYGLPTDLAAKQMGHSVEVHEATYHRWIKPDLHQRVYNLVTSRADRPLAPGVHSTLSSASHLETCQR
jgi:integrase